MDIHKRKLLKILAATTALAPLSKFSLAETNQQVFFLGISSRYNGKYYLNGLDKTGKQIYALPLTSRAHDISLQPNGHHAVITARRPGYYLLVFDTPTGKPLFELSPNDNHHLYGHSLFSNDGHWLYSSENDFENKRGIICKRDCFNDYKIVDEFPSYGIGPHEIAMLSDKKTLVVANGGILTHPDTGRTQLNLDTMSPSLAYIDTDSGELIDSIKLDHSLHQNSIRHLAVTPQDDVCFAMQFSGNPNSRPPLVGTHKLGQAISLLNAPPLIQSSMKNYCGSVEIDHSGKIAAISSPKGSIITFWSIKESRYLDNITVDDGCGISTTNIANEFIITSGNGGIYSYKVLEKKLSTLTNNYQDRYQWDNHLSRILS